jgi:hypothetical protein
MQAVQVFYGILPLIAAVLLAMVNNNARLDEVSQTHGRSAQFAQQSY